MIFEPSLLAAEGPDEERRTRADRRDAPTSAWSALGWEGLRMFARRWDEHRRPYFVDRFSSAMWVAVVLVLVLSMIDAVITLYLLDFDCNEANPLMSHLLHNGILSFVLGKYVLTAGGLPLLLLLKNHCLFGTRFRVGYLIPAIVVMYVALLAYQVHLLPAHSLV